MTRSILVGLALLCASACAPRQPARWVEGGAPLDVGEAVWARPGESTVTLSANGVVMVNGDLELSVDTLGRVYSDDGDALALLSTDGQVFTQDNDYAGRVGMHNASPPWSSVAWLRIQDDGTVLWFDEAGKAHTAGRWSGCEGARLRTCTLITHLSLLASSEERSRARHVQSYHYTYPYYSPGFTFGMGYWY